MRYSRYVTSDIGTVVLLHADGKGYEVEFVTLGGEIIAVTRLLTTQVHPILHKEKERIRGQNAGNRVCGSGDSGSARYRSAPKTNQ